MFFYWIKRLFGFNSDVVYMCAYVLPENSPYYTAFDIDDGISLLEESFADVMLSLDDVYILLCGDLKSRTANEFPISQSGNDVFTRPVEENTNEMFGGHCIEFIRGKVTEYMYHFWIEYFEWSL